MKNIVILVIFICSCSHFRANEQKIGHIKKILIFGNSILKHEPDSSICWYNNWGMAASSIDSDFLHILIQYIKDTSCKIFTKTVVDFEHNYKQFNLHSLDSFKEINADIIIMRFGENVANNAGQDFINKYRDFINYIKNDSTIIVITDGFWPHKNVNHLIKNFALKNEYTFIELSQLSTNENEALNKFKHAGVAMHPNDKGMKAIADELWKYLSIYFQ